MRKKEMSKAERGHKKPADNPSAEDQQSVMDLHDPRVRYLNKLQKIWVSCAVLAVFSGIVGFLAPDEWKTDIGILCFILAVVCAAHFLYCYYLAKAWGIQMGEKDEKSDE